MATSFRSCKDDGHHPEANPHPNKMAGTEASPKGPVFDGRGGFPGPGLSQRDKTIQICRAGISQDQDD
jgi:hypothetical protein